MSDNKIRVALERRDRIVFRRDVEEAGIPSKRFRPLPPYWTAANTVGRVVVDDFWYETQIDSAWVAAYRIVAQPDGLVVGEIRIFPVDETWDKRRRRAGEWGGHLQGTRATAPRGGVTARLLRKVKIDESVWFGREVLQYLSRHRGKVTGNKHPGRGRFYVPWALEEAGIGAERWAPPERRQRRGRKPVPAQETQRLAEAYARLWFRGVRGRQLDQQVAERLHLSETQVRNRISRARRKGLLPFMPARGRSTHR